MKYSPKYVLFFAAYRMLSPDAREALLADFAQEKPILTPKFLAVLKRHFDFEWLKDKPVIWQDIWLYNYLTYDVEGKMKSNPLFRKYYKLVEKDLTAHYPIFRFIALYLA
jgi:hypothetical protein